jgi:RimJ/RimL family protein N-acetyltransferase
MEREAVAAGELTLRRMTVADLVLVRAWLGAPHVARWYLSAATVEAEVDELRLCVELEEPTEALLVSQGARPIGWCQWYRCSDYPEHAAGVAAGPDDIGIDYAIGEVESTARGIGTALIAALVGHVRERHPLAGVIADPEAANIASRRVLEKNGFELLSEGPVSSEPTTAPMAIYRLAAPGEGVRSGTQP